MSDTSDDVNNGEEFDEASVWAGAGIMSLLAALGVASVVYVPDVTPWLAILTFVTFAAFCIWQSYRDYDGPLYGEVEA